MASCEKLLPIAKIRMVSFLLMELDGCAQIEREENTSDSKKQILKGVKFFIIKIDFVDKRIRSTVYCSEI